MSDAISIVSGLSDIPIHMLSIIRMPFLKRETKNPTPNGLPVLIWYLVYNVPNDIIFRLALLDAAQEQSIACLYFFKAVPYRGLSLYAIDPSPFLQFVDLPKECANLNSILLEI